MFLLPALDQFVTVFYLVIHERAEWFLWQVLLCCRFILQVIFFKINDYFLLIFLRGLIERMNGFFNWLLVYPVILILFHFISYYVRINVVPVYYIGLMCSLRQLSNSVWWSRFKALYDDCIWVELTPKSSPSPVNKIRGYF